MNFTYAKNPCASNVPVPVVMQRGSFSYFDKNMGTGFDLQVESVKEGSLASGTRQAVVVIACDFPVGGTAAAYLFDEGKTGADKRNAGAVLLARVGEANWGGDWGAGPDSIKIAFADRVLSITDCADTDCKKEKTVTYRFRAGKLVKR